ncbi:hypothetical protein SHIRM173S_03237 [Streptomyces hirsutus]
MASLITPMSACGLSVRTASIVFSPAGMSREMWSTDSMTNWRTPPPLVSRS